MTKNYVDCFEYLSERFSQVGGKEFYSELFPDNEVFGELYDDFSHPNAIYLYYDSEKKKMRRRIMLSDQWEDDYESCVKGNSMTLCSGLTYRRRENKLGNAQRMNALIFDIDGVGASEIRSFFLRFGGDPQLPRRLPMPTFIVLSGNGVHLYYQFETPIDLYPNIKVQLKSLKYDLTYRMWDYKGTSQVESIQYQSINQTFRMVGSVNDKYGSEVVAFRTGGKVGLEYMNAYATNPKNRVDVNKPFAPTRMTREQAKEAYPEWYQRVVVEGNKRKKKWDIAGKVHGNDPYALYHWWFNKAGLVKGGHRYFYLMCLAIYAYKCDVPKAQLRKDMQVAYEILKRVSHDNDLTQEDVKSALEAYDKEYYNFTRADIEYLTELRIDKNTRHGRRRNAHIRYMNHQRAFKVEEGECTNGGRPRGSGTKAQQVWEWRAAHPEGRKIDCFRDTGMSRVTIDKWWDQERTD